MGFYERLYIAAFALIASTHGGLAFGTLNFLGQSAEHEKITTLGLKSFDLGLWTLDALKGHRGVFGAVGAPDDPRRGLIFESRAHCDNGDTLDEADYPRKKAEANAQLAGCRLWMFDHLEAAVEAAGTLVDPAMTIRSPDSSEIQACIFDGNETSAKCRVLAALGVALHASQDFYSHTNWSDAVADGQGTLEDPPGLGQDGPAPWLDPRLDEPFPDGLISGCFSGVPEFFFCRGRVKHVVLNKDTGPINPKTGEIGFGSTPRSKGNNNFQRAVRAAIADTRDKWTFFEERVIAKYGSERGPLIMCVVRKDDPTACQ